MTFSGLRQRDSGEKEEGELQPEILDHVTENLGCQLAWGPREVWLLARTAWRQGQLLRRQIPR